VAIWIDMQHDARTGEWTVTGRSTVSARKLPPWKALRWPDVDAWWQFVRASDPELAGELRGEEARQEFGSILASVQTMCSCDACRETVTARGELANGALARAARMARAEDRAAGLTYAEARTRYMDTGTITDKEAMLACVTMTVPDLDTLGRDWGPASPELRATAEIGTAAPMQRPRRNLALGCAAMLAVGLAVAFTAGIGAGIALIASAAAGFTLAFTARR
jgi:hypothetical protein